MRAPRPDVQTVEFGSLLIDFDRRVLRPRRWTTSQSAWSADLLATAPPGPVLELCAGAGQIGLLAVAGHLRDLVLVDSDDTACHYARVNAARAGLAHRVDVRCGDLASAVRPDERFAAVLADPPWVPSRSVRRYPDDPPTAIDGGPDGMAVTWRCLETIANHLADGGHAVLQLGSPAQVARLRREVTPDRRLEFVSCRSYGVRGVLVLLHRRVGGF